jgi:aminoglycoside phosphotransferase (APT) family kinase protein
MTGPVSDFQAVAKGLGGLLGTAEPVGRGDARATHRLTLADGRRFAARHFSTSVQPERIEQIASLMTRLAALGLPVPPPTVVETGEHAWLVTPWVDGETGAEWLADPDRAGQLADQMGRLARRVRGIRLDTLAHRKRPPHVDAADTTESIALVHGDFAPINVVMDPGGEIRALLDFEHAGVGPELLDVAWWGWVVRHHHPAAWTAAWPTFLRAAGLEPGPAELQLHALALGALAGRVAAADDQGRRRRWRERLSTAQTWTVPAGQAT